MKLHNPELVGALLDGELKGLQRWLVRRHVARCAFCAAEYRHQHHVRLMLAENSSPVPPMSDTPEFFWSKVKREIQAQGDQPCQAPVPRLSLFDWLDGHRYAMAGVATACLVAAVGVVWIVQAHRSGTVEVSTPPQRLVVSHVIPSPAVSVEHVATFIAHSAATPLPAKDDDDSVIWTSGLPWTPDMTQMKTVYANLDS